MFNDDVDIVEPSFYTFVFEEDNGGWWLKLSNANDVGDYYKKTESMYGKCLLDYMKYKEEYDKTGNRMIFDSKRTTAIVMYAEQKHLTIIDAIMQFRMKIAAEQMERIRATGAIYVNKAGGYHSGSTYSQFVHRKTFTWPDFKESDIRISKFPGGTHWYVHIGDMELHENNNIKWNTHEQAFAAAKRYVSKED